MKIHENEADMQVAALKVLLELTNQNETKFTQHDKKFIAELMRKHITTVDIQILGCRLLAVLASDGKSKFQIFCWYFSYSCVCAVFISTQSQIFEVNYFIKDFKRINSREFLNNSNKIKL